MKITVLRPVELDVRSIRLYLNDNVADPDDDVSCLDFDKSKGFIALLIDLATGKILNWKGKSAVDFYWKTNDTCCFWLLDQNDREIDLKTVSGNYAAEVFYEGYVPDFLPNKYGDYLDLQISADGVVTNWKTEKMQALLQEFFDRDDD